MMILIIPLNSNVICNTDFLNLYLLYTIHLFHLFLMEFLSFFAIASFSLLSGSGVFLFYVSIHFFYFYVYKMDFYASCLVFCYDVRKIIFFIYNSMLFVEFYSFVTRFSILYTRLFFSVF